MPFMDRESFIHLLDRLGDADDASVLAAAREIHRRMGEAGIGWDELLIRPDMEEETATDLPAVAAPALELEDDSHSIPAGDAEDAALIDRLLADLPLSPDTRQELMDLKGDIAAGEFTAADSRYLRNLAARLSRRKAG